MRTQAYRCFEVVAWPALVWAVFELVVEASTGGWERVPESAFMALMAGAMVVCARWRMASSRRTPGALAETRA